MYLDPVPGNCYTSSYTEATGAPVKIVTAAQVKQIDRNCADIGLPTGQLMENAGKAFVEETVRLLAGARQNIVMLIGPGNNGGDGLAAAPRQGARSAEVVLPSSRSDAAYEAWLRAMRKAWVPPPLSTVL